MKTWKNYKRINGSRSYRNAYACEYTDMRGIDRKTCIHHIYIEKNARLVR